MVIIDDLDAKVNSDNTLLVDVMVKCAFDDRNNHGERFVNFSSIHLLVIDGTWLTHKVIVAVIF